MTLTLEGFTIGSIIIAILGAILLFSSSTFPPWRSSRSRSASDVSYFAKPLRRAAAPEATNTRGGGIWTYASGGLQNAIVTTTGNVRSGNSSEPSVNHALAMVRINQTTGAEEGKVQPVPYEEDGDPDWAAGAALMSASCGDLAVSTMKDGWTYAVMQLLSSSIDLSS